MYLKGVCCELCQHVRTDNCPVESAAPWSRWYDWCGNYRPNPEIAEAKSIEQAVCASLAEQLLRKEGWAEQADLIHALERMSCRG